MSVSKVGELAPPPKNCTKLFIPFGIDSRYFIVTTWNRDTNWAAEPVVHRYNISTNQWDQYKKSSDQNGFITVPPKPFWCSKTETLYWSQGNVVKMVKLNEYGQTSIPHSVNVGGIDIRCLATPMMVNNEFHVIGGLGNNAHRKYNFESGSVDVCQFPDFSSHVTHYQIALVDNNMYMFVHLGIYKYNNNRHVWTKLDCTIPPWGLYDGVTVTTAVNKQFILCFTGSGNIFIFSLSSETFTKSNLQCPLTVDNSAPYYAVTCTVEGELADDILVQGYVRKQWKLSEISTHLFPDLIKMMYRYYATEYVHLIHPYTGSHLRMNTLDIVFGNSNEQTNDIIRSHSDYNYYNREIISDVYDD